MSVVITPEEIGNIAANSNDSLIKFSDTGCFLPIMVNTWGGFVHNVTVRFPKFHLLPQYAGYSQWTVNMTVEIPEDGTSRFMAFSIVRGPSVQPYDMLTDSQVVDDGDYFKLVQPLALSQWSLVLPPGTYYNYIKCTITAVAPTGGVPFTIAQSYLYPVKATVSASETPAFSVNYFGSSTGFLNFIYRRGSGVINSQNVFVYTNTPLTYVVDGTDLFTTVVTTELHDLYFRKVMLTYADPSVDPAPGVYTGNIIISSADESKVVPFRVYVTDAGAFDVSPNNLDFMAITGLEAPGQPLYIFTDTTWRITQVPAWLVLSYDAGINMAVVTATVDTSALTLGNYNAELAIAAGGVTKYVTVNLTYSAFLTTPITAGGLFFSKELYYLVFSSLNQAKIQLNLEIVVRSLDLTRNKTYMRQYELPLFAGQASFHIGTVVDQLFGQAEDLADLVDEFTQNHLRTQYRPAEISVYYSEVDLITGAVTNVGSIEGVFMARGSRPQLTDASFGLINVMRQDFSRLSPDSMINCNFSALSPATVFVKKNGVVQEQFIIPALGRDIFYSYFRYDEQLVPGDVVEIMLKGDFSRTRRFLVLPPGKESTHVFFENENGLVEVFEFTGRRRLQSAYTHTTAERFKNLYARKEKLKSDNVQAVIVNTGYILAGDHKVVDAIIKSPRVWLSFDSRFGPYFRADATSTKLANADTDISETAFEVEFNILDNADATIYLQ